MHPKAGKHCQDRWPVSQQVLIVASASAAKQRPFPISNSENVDLLHDATDAATGKHRHGDVAVYVDRHRRESPATTQPRHRLRTARLDQHHALCQSVISHHSPLSHRSPSIGGCRVIGALPDSHIEQEK